MRLVELLSPRDVKNLEQELNDELYQTPKALGSKAPAVKLVLPTNAHFMDRLKQRGDAQHITAPEISDLLTKARRDPSLGVSKKIDQLAKMNNPDDTIILQDPKTQLTIPVVFNQNNNCAFGQNLQDGNSTCRSKFGMKEPKNIMVAKTIYRKDKHNNFHEDRIDELQPSVVRNLKKMDDKSHSNLTAFLSKHGFKQLGSGAYSSVWGVENSNNVVKISYTDDKCWVEFSEYVAKNKNKHFPRISRVMAYYDPKNQTTNFYCFIEKLQTLDHIPRIPENAPLFAYLKAKQKIDIIFYFAREEYNVVFGTYNRSIDLNAIAEEYVDKQTLDQAISLLKNNKPTLCSWDMHSGNIMWREKTKTLVITDPYA